MSPSPVTSLSIPAALLRSRASLRRAQALPGGVWIAQWRNADTEADYQQPGHHTLSLYLQGGHAVRCHQAPQARGEPGALCLLPAGHDSRWDVNGALELLHIYLPRLELAAAAERWFDLDPRLATLAEDIYFHDASLEALGRRIAAADWSAPDAALALQPLVLDLQGRLIETHASRRRSLPRQRGGLSDAARRRVLEYVEAGLDAGRAASLDELAAAACLSSFHFARMFAASFGCSPHAWVMRRRLERARTLLARSRLPLEELAQRCGYAHLSHLNTALRRAGLPSASRWRDATAPAALRSAAASCS